MLQSAECVLLWLEGGWKVSRCCLEGVWEKSVNSFKSVNSGKSFNSDKLVNLGKSINSGKSVNSGNLSIQTLLTADFIANQLLRESARKRVRYQEIQFD